LKMLSSASSDSGPVVTWQSANGVVYFVQSSADIGLPPAFSTIQNDIVGQAGTTSYTDTNASGPGPFFYRVGVQQP